MEFVALLTRRFHPIARAVPLYKFLGYRIFSDYLNVLWKNLRQVNRSVRHPKPSRSFMRYFLILFSIVFVLGCVPYSDNPLTAPNKEQIDSSILGTWFWKDENESGYIHIGLDEKSKLLRLMMLEFDRDGELEASEFSGHTSSLNGNKYLNLKWVRPVQGEITGYIFVKYVVSSDSLCIAFMDSDVAEKAINDGSLKGKVKKGNWSSSVHITEGQKKLQEFILQKDKELFSEIKCLPKLKLPNKRSEQTPKSGAAQANRSATQSLTTREEGSLC